jgi:RimJ/RimL family protein N-acetyltransferase
MDPRLQGERVNLRPLTLEDLTPLAELLRAPAVREWWGEYDEARLRWEFLDNPSVGVFAACLDNRLVGVVGTCPRTPSRW